MNTFVTLSDDQAQVLAGGFDFFSSSEVFKLSSTNVGQLNNANNYGIGAVVGAGTAMSWQANGATVVTGIG
jgi:hypothetical protein